MSLTSDPGYPALKAMLIRATGMEYYADKDEDLARQLERRMTELNFESCASYLDRLNDPALGRAEFDELIAEITIGETYFFRHREHFDALRDLVLPDLLARNAARRSLRIWSAGCADGPEPYSLAILLERDLHYQTSGWAIDILATDINRRALERARQGRFQDWALRATPDEIKRDCFSKEDKAWRIAPKFRERISFQYFNLISEDPPPLFASSFDLILCRNVTIYFAPDATRAIVQRFHDSLCEGSWLLVGPTEPNMRHFTSFLPVNAPGVTLYQKVPLPPPKPVAAAPSPLPRAPAPASRRPPAAPPSDRNFASLRLYADRGEWDKALRCCESLLGGDGLNSHAHFFHALILQHAGRIAEAETALRKSIYLDRRAALAHYYLGMLLQARGDARQAARSFENTVDLLAGLDDAQPFADADGLTVADLRKLAHTQLGAMGGE